MKAIYNAQQIEIETQQEWEKNHSFEVTEDANKEKLEQVKSMKKEKGEPTKPERSPYAPNFDAVPMASNDNDNSIFIPS